MTEAADHRQDPFGIGIVAASHVHAEPDHGFAGALRIGLVDDGLAQTGEFSARAAFFTGSLVGTVAFARRAFGTLSALGCAASFKQFFRSWQAGAIHAHQRPGDFLSGAISHQHLGESQVFFRARLGEDRIFLHALLIGESNFFSRWRVAPQHVDARLRNQRLRLAALGIGDEQHARALAASAARASAAMKQGVAIARKFSVNHQLDARQIDAARRHVGGHADSGAPVPQRLQRMRAFALRIFA